MSLIKLESNNDIYKFFASNVNKVNYSFALKFLTKEYHLLSKITSEHRKITSSG